MRDSLVARKVFAKTDGRPEARASERQGFDPRRPKRASSEARRFSPSPGLPVGLRSRADEAAGESGAK